MSGFLSSISNAASALSSALSSLAGRGASWTRDAALAYASLLRSLLIPLGVLTVAALAVFGGGIVSGSAWMVSTAIVLLGVLAALFLLVTAPVWMLASKFVELAGLQRHVRFLGATLLWFFFVALLLSFIPPSARNVGLVVLGSVILALLGAVSGKWPSPGLVYLKVLIVLVLSLVTPLFPEVSEAIRDFFWHLDRKVADQVRGDARVPIVRCEDFAHIRFFDVKDGSPRISYLRDDSNQIVFFERGDFDPASGKKLRVITQAVVTEARNQCEERERKALERRAQANTQQEPARPNRRAASDVGELGEGSSGGPSSNTAPNSYPHQSPPSRTIQVGRYLVYEADWPQVVLDSVDVLDNRRLRVNVTFVNGLNGEISLAPSRPEQNTYGLDPAGYALSYAGGRASETLRLRPGERRQVSIVLVGRNVENMQYFSFRSQWTVRGPVTGAFGATKTIVASQLQL